MLLCIVVNDCYNYKVNNKLIVIGSILALACQLYGHGWTGMITFSVGYLIPFFLLFLLFVCRMLGAGDIKVFCMIGGFYGWQMGVQCIFYSFLVGAVFSIISILIHPKLLLRFQYFLNYLYTCFITKKLKPYLSEDTEKLAILHFTVSIAVGFGVLAVRHGLLIE